jgi:hypothetical protein
VGRHLVGAALSTQPGGGHPHTVFDRRFTAFFPDGLATGM